MSNGEQDKLTTSFLPRHVAIIMDGNGRWARERGKPRHAGHQAGARAAQVVVETAGREGIEVLTLFAFSSENWSRPKGEVSRLMDLFRRAIKQSVPRLHENGVRLRFLGDRSRFPGDLQQRMLDAEALTRENHRLNLNIAAGYGGRWDILQATRRIATAVASGELDIDSVDEARFSACLSLAELPEPDLFIRTGGERRISNFFLWDLAYTELHFTDRLWPDFGEDCFRQALNDFAERERRFGGVGKDGETRNA